MRRPTTRRSAAILHGLAALLLACLALGACASDGGSAEAGSETASEAPPKGVAPPAGHPLAKVEMKMRPDQVRSIMGDPDSQHTYPGAIWKRFIPFYYGADSGNRVEYAYAGQGRVVFSVNAYTGQLNVVRVDYDPDEEGR